MGPDRSRQIRSGHAFTYSRISGRYNSGAMENEMLRLKDFDFGKTDVNPNEVAGFNSESQYMALCVELAKEAFKITSILAASYRLDSNNKPRKWTRNEAIIGGLFVRQAKLQMAMLDSVCQKRQEIVDIVFRCFAETIVNVQYLMQEGEGSHDEYVRYSLRTEKKLLKLVESNVSARGYELPI